jgi:hypothetical protein
VPSTGTDLRAVTACAAGVLAVLGMVVGFVPCLGALNWLNVPFALAGAVVSAIALGTTKDQKKGASLAGLLCCGGAAFFGLVRLVLGGGVV